MRAINPFTVESIAKGIERTGRLIKSTFLLLSFGLLAVPIPTPSQREKGNQYEKREHLYRYLVPDGYVGWVRVDFNVRDASPLPVEDSFHILKIPKTGRLRTSTEDEYGIVGDEYYYYCRDNRRRLEIDATKPTCMIDGNFQGPGVFTYETPYKYRYFFAGPKQEYKKFQFSGENLEKLQLESDGYPKVGSISPLACDE